MKVYTIENLHENGIIAIVRDLNTAIDTIAEQLDEYLEDNDLTIDIQYEKKLPHQYWVDVFYIDKDDKIVSKDTYIVEEHYVK